MMILKGLRVGELQELVGDAMEPVLKPLVYEDPVRLVREHHERGEPVYIVSATLQEIVDELARELGFDGALGSICEIVDGMYTGRVVRPCHGAGEGPRCAGARLSERPAVEAGAPRHPARARGRRRGLGRDAS